MVSLFAKFAQIALLSFAGSALADPPSRTLRDCELDFRKQPADYRAARCFYEVGRGEKSEAARAAIASLEVEFPQAHYLKVVAAHFWWDANPSRALVGYRSAAEQFSLSGDVEGEIVARANLHFLLHELNQFASSEQQALKIRELGSRAQNAQTRARALVTFSSYSLLNSRNLGVTYQDLRGLSAQEINELPYSIQKDLYWARAGIAIELSEYDKARQDYTEWTKLAREKSDWVGLALAADGFAGILLRKFRAAGGSVEFQQTVIEALENARRAARKAKRIGSEARRLEELAAVIAYDPKREEEALTRVNECLRLTQNSNRNNVAGLCLARRSAIVARRDSKSAYQDSKRGLALLHNSAELDQRAQGWRYFMRSAWQHVPKAEAKKLALIALSAVEDLRSAQKNPSARRKSFANWTEDYYWLATRLLREKAKDPESLRSAFALSDRVRGRVMLEFVTGYEPENEPMPAKAQGEAIEESAPAEESWQYDSDPAIWQGKYQDAIDEAKRVFAARELQNRSWVDDLQSALEPDEFMIAYQVAPDHNLEGVDLGGVWGYVVSKNGIFAEQLPISRSELRDANRTLFSLVQKQSPGVPGLVEALHRKLFEPLEPLFPKDAKRIVVVPDDILHTLPFPLLQPEYAMTLAPSARYWLNRRRTSTEGGVALGLAIADPKRAANLDEISQAQGFRLANEKRNYEALPASRLEVELLRGHLGRNVKLLVGAEAKKSKLRSKWREDFNFLHLSAHSVVDQHSPENSAVILATESGDAKGLLSVKEIEDWDLRNTVVILASCSTGTGNTMGGEGVLSIASAFQRAGAKAVVANLWRIKDQKAAVFFEHFYRLLAEGASLDIALHQSQDYFRQAGWPRADYGSYIVLGDGNFAFDPPPSHRWKIWLAEGPVEWFGGVLAGLLVMGWVLRGYIFSRPA